MSLMTAPVYGLTPSQADCARVIAALTDFLGNSPSFEEIRAELCVSNKSRVHTLVQALIERGWIKTGPVERAQRRSVFAAPRPARSLRLTRSPPPFNGNPITITEAGREYLRIAGEAA